MLQRTLILTILSLAALQVLGQDEDPPVDYAALGIPELILDCTEYGCAVVNYQVTAVEDQVTIKAPDTPNIHLNTTIPSNSTAAPAQAPVAKKIGLQKDAKVNPINKKK